MKQVTSTENVRFMKPGDKSLYILQVAQVCAIHYEYSPGYFGLRSHILPGFLYNR
ncbi:MAG: hypothetical protein Q8942_01370 [Bacillota bacterium]|nr:hypothetical protein [Bacillota bacterium]